MKEAFYFSHDSNARHDPKILEMRSVYGMEGYGWYWVIIEMLREQEDYRIKITKHVYNAFAMQMQCTADAVHSYIDACINEFDLLVSDGEYFWSESLLNRMKVKDEKSQKAKKAANARWQKDSNSKGSMQLQSESNANAMQTQCEGNAIKESKRKEIKEKEIKEIGIGEKETPPAAQSKYPIHDSNWYDTFMIAFEKQPNAIQREEINSFIDIDMLEVGQVCLAFQKAGENGANYAYSRTILNSWVKKKILTLEDAIKEQERFEQQKRNRQQPNNNKNDKLPKWMADEGKQNSNGPVSEQQRKEMELATAGL